MVTLVLKYDSGESRNGLYSITSIHQTVLYIYIPVSEDLTPTVRDTQTTFGSGGKLCV